MDKQFVPYDISVELKAIGFNEPCIAYYTHNERLSRYNSSQIGVDFDTCKHENIYPPYSLAPLYQQAFDFLREEYGYYYCGPVKSQHKNKGWIGVVRYIPDYMFEYATESLLTTEEAREVCLRKMIELVKKDNDNG